MRDDSCQRLVALRAFAIWLVLAAVASPARADHGFVWLAPEPCPDAADVRARIELRLGASLDGAVEGVEVEIASSDSGFVARIDPRGFGLEQQIRTLTSARCDELADAVAVVVARLATEARTRIEARRRATVIPMAGVIEPEVRRDPGAWGGGVRAVGVSGIGSLPGVGVGGELALHARHRKRFLELAGGLWAPSPMFLTNGAPGGVEVSLMTLDARAGWSPTDMYIRGWFSTEVGVMKGVGRALIDPRIGSARWIAAGAGFGVVWPMSPWSRLVGTIEVLVPIERARFVLAEGVEIYRPSFASVRTSLGLEIGWR